MDDLISRQAAIDAVADELKGIFVEYRDIAEKMIGKLPSAQPEPCVDTIDALNESIKHFDDMAEECRRNANIERNDYMDMRDDAAEYRQLSTWLNELRWLRERFQSQPQRKKGKWIDYTDEGYVECPFCHSATNCDGNKDELHFCFSCGADMRGKQDD